jgi:hypothetical protein
MSDFKDLELYNLTVHFVGNSQNEEGFSLSKKPLTLDNEDLQLLLLKYFLNPLKNKEHYQFKTEEEGATFKETIKQAFQDPDSFFLKTITLAERLYEKSTHHMIKGGEFYCLYLKNCEFEGEITDAIGFFKSENKETFLKVFSQGDSFDISSEQGININKLDKGCIIYNVNEASGYKIQIVDNTSKANEAQYWKEDFLQIEKCSDSYHYTENYLQLCNNFVNERLPEEFEVSKIDQIEFMRKSVDYFKKNEDFDFNEFTKEVLPQPEISDSFRNYKKEFVEQFGTPVVDEFDISMPALKKQSRVYKSVLKLDKNFHIYIHGNKDLIEKGFDEAKDMKYYKVYYREES